MLKMVSKADVRKAKLRQQSRAWKIAHPGRHRKWRYGVTDEEFASLMGKQNGQCAICKADITEKKSACLDHCHNTKQTRGLLCFTCNRAIGLLKEDISILQRAIFYLTNPVSLR